MPICDCFFDYNIIFLQKQREALLQAVQGGGTGEVLDGRHTANVTKKNVYNKKNRFQTRVQTSGGSDVDGNELDAEGCMKKVS